MPNINDRSGFGMDWSHLVHPCPEWFRDAKSGLYFHWGPYSVPGFGSEWYSRFMYLAGTDDHRHHIEKYGSLDKFGYKDFIPMFTGEKFNAEEWADLIVKSGAKYAGPVTEHSDGFSMWKSGVNPVNAFNMGPKRDIVGEMADAIRARDLKFIATFHHAFLWGWYASNEANADVFDPENEQYYGKALPVSAFRIVPDVPELFNYPRPMPDREFCDNWRDKVIEVIDKYNPDLIYFDGRTAIIDEKIRHEFLNYYYKHAAERNQDVLVTYKDKDFYENTGVPDLESGRMSEIRDFVWQNDDKVDWKSWGYIRDPNFKTPTRLVHSLVDVVSKNGNLLLNVGPKPDGTIPEEAGAILLELGRWLKLNGEAIYGTRPFTVFGEGPTQVAGGALNEADINNFTREDIRFTINGDTLYAILLGWPEKEAVIKSLNQQVKLPCGDINEVGMLGVDMKLKWRRDQGALTVQLPEKMPCEHAFVLKVK